MGWSCTSRYSLARYFRLSMVAFWAALAACPSEARSPETKTPARQGAAIVGVNFVNPDRLPVQEQDAMLDAMQAAGVTTIRTKIVPGEAGLRLARAAQARGIRILLIAPLRFDADARMRPYQPEKFPLVWSVAPLSRASAARSRDAFAELMAGLERAGIELSGIEIGNEINTTAFNGDFPVPGRGLQLGLKDLQEDPVGRQIAKGYDRYLEILTEMKKIRDGSRINRRTPLISAGLAAYEGPEGLMNGAKLDMVSANATIDYWRQRGLDSLVDGYGMHVYPWANKPGDSAAAQGRRTRLARYVLSRCGIGGDSERKPCWLTEWGFKNISAACPADDAVQAALVREMRQSFSASIQQGRLKGVLYYAWLDKVEHFGVYRCGTLTETGRSALSPM